MKPTFGGQKVHQKLWSDVIFDIDHSKLTIVLRRQVLDLYYLQL